MDAKHAARAPYYYFFNTIPQSQETHNQNHCITFREILDSTLGKLKESTQINFLVDMKWLLAEYEAAGYKNVPLNVIHGSRSFLVERSNLIYPRNVNVAEKVLRNSFATHHTKMMILKYDDDSVRVVVSTANLFPEDWECRTQGVWISPRCPVLPENSQESGESPTSFKENLLRYLEYYEMSLLAPCINHLRKCDFRQINVFLITTVTGTHPVGTNYHGIRQLGPLIREHCAIPPEENENWPLVATISSIGSLGSTAEEWLIKQFLQHMAAGPEQNEEFRPPQFQVIFPTQQNVDNAYNVQVAARTYEYRSETHNKQLWLNDYFYQWLATSTGRDRVVPHVKTYTRISPDNKMAAYFLLTSANLSKGAWGKINIGNKGLNVLSYEAGVLFLPKFVNTNAEGNTYFPLEGDGRLILPYDIPTTKYIIMSCVLVDN